MDTPPLASTSRRRAGPLVCRHTFAVPASYVQITLIGCCCMLAVAALSYWLLQARPVYILDFGVYRAPERCAHCQPCRTMLRTAGACAKCPGSLRPVCTDLHGPKVPPLALQH